MNVKSVMDWGEPKGFSAFSTKVPQGSWLDHPPRRELHWKAHPKQILLSRKLWKVVAFVSPDFQLSHIHQAIQDSKKILDLAEDFDDQGSPAYEESTWNRAGRFVEKYAERLLVKSGAIFPAPKILPGPEGSIDVLWKSDEIQLLVNFPQKSEDPAEFYGERKGGFHFKGTLDPSVFNEGLLEWLTNLE